MIKAACEELRGVQCTLRFCRDGNKSVYLTLPEELQELRCKLDSIWPWCRGHGDDDTTGHVEGGRALLNEDKEIHMCCDFRYRSVGGRGNGGGRGGRGGGWRGRGRAGGQHSSASASSTTTTASASTHQEEKEKE